MRLVQARDQKARVNLAVMVAQSSIANTADGRKKPLQSGDPRCTPNFFAAGCLTTPVQGSTMRVDWLPAFVPPCPAADSRPHPSNRPDGPPSPATHRPTDSLADLLVT